MATIREVTDYLEKLAPRAYQESYDNSGLLTGDPTSEVKAILVTLDCTEAVIDEAFRLGCNLVICHHPILFKGIKKLTGQNYVERTLIQAIRNHLAIYAIHTNLDHVASGVSKQIANKLGLKNCKVLLPRTDTLAKLVTFIPPDHQNAVLEALYKAGAGDIGFYKNCSFSLNGEGTFQAKEGANPYVGKVNELEKVKELRSEVIFPIHLKGKILLALHNTHPYEEVAYYISRLENENQEVGAGIIGELATPLEPLKALRHIQSAMNTDCIRHTTITNAPVTKIAVCGGSGSYLLPTAIARGAQIFVSADFKYHEFFDAEDLIIIADIGHYESEQYTKDLLVDVLKEKFTTFAINFSETITNPISYLYK